MLSPVPRTIAPMVVFHAERFAAGGDAIARDADGRVVFVDGAIPGETVEARVTQRKRDFARAVVEEVLDPSPDRVAPPCPALAAGCGGCEWQHIAPVAQMAAKVDIVRDAFRRTAWMPDARIEPGASVGPWAYRTSMRVAASRSGRLGLRARGAHDIVELDDCLVAHPRLAELLGTLRIAGGGAARGEVSLRVSVATAERTAWLDGRGSSKLLGVPSDVAVGPEATLGEVIDGRALRVSARSFFQSGPAAAELLVDAVRRASVDADGRSPHGSVVDAYGGVGLFAATALATAERVVVVELSESACADARVNLAGTNATIVESAVERWAPTAADLVVADPARAGLGAAGVERLGATGAGRLVLVSCDPVAAARDAALLVTAGFRHARSEVLDLFPNTVHVEVVTQFER